MHPKTEKVKKFLSEVPGGEYYYSDLQELFLKENKEVVRDDLLRKVLRQEKDWDRIGSGNNVRWRNTHKLNSKQTIEFRVKEMVGKYNMKSPYKKRKFLPFNILGFNHSEPDFPVQVYTIGYERGEHHHDQPLDIYDDYSLESIENMLKEGLLQKTKNN